jgi:agmatine/peptidylarginine deiminase
MTVAPATTLADSGVSDPFDRVLDSSPSGGSAPATVDTPVDAPCPWLPFGSCLPGEFERHEAMLLSCDELAAQYPRLLADIVSATWRRLSLVAIVSRQEDGRYVSKILSENQLPARSVRFLRIPHDSMWIRDYGPFSLKRGDGRCLIVDAGYGRHADRLNDDNVPVILSDLLRATLVQAPLALEGGNLLSNGQGLCLTTKSLLDNNFDQNLDEAGARRLLREYLGARHTVFLDKLEGEPTGHIDMFATLVSSDTVVVGSYDPAVDPLNAAVLDRNAARLAEVRTGRGRLRVVRVPMPTNQDGTWRTYTNVIYANGAVLVPVYPEVDAAVRDEALAVFRRVLPRWQVVAVDCSEIIQSGGALHCISKGFVSLQGWQGGQERQVAVLLRDAPR